MSDRTEKTSTSSQKPTYSLVVVPEHLRGEVMEYVASLEERDDVSGFMLASRGGAVASAIACAASTINEGPGDSACSMSDS